MSRLPVLRDGRAIGLVDAEADSVIVLCCQVVSRMVTILLLRTFARAIASTSGWSSLRCRLQRSATARCCTVTSARVSERDEFCAVA